jgi:hypothetical protein
MKMTYSTSNAQRPTLNAKPSVELHIEELVLHGFAPGHRYAISESIERELARLLDEPGAANLLRSENPMDEIKGATFHAVHNSKPAVIGQQIARAMYEGFRQ